MGNCGTPHGIILKLAQLSGATVFIETGTYHGATARWASGHFESVFTIERCEELYHLHREELSRLRGVSPILGDSRTVLPSIVEGLGPRKAVLWLDGHWSGGNTAGADEECPLLGELTSLSNRTGDIVLIDDARLFLSAPPRPYNPSQWPTISEILEAFSGWRDRPYVQIVDDVIFAVSNEDSLRQTLRQYARDRADFREKFGWLERGMFRNRALYQFLSRIAKRMIPAG